MFYEKPHFEYCDGHDVDWVATTFFECGCNAKGLSDRRNFVEEVLGLDCYATPDLEERVKVSLDAKVHELFTSHLSEYCIREEEAAEKEAAAGPGHNGAMGHWYARTGQEAPAAERRPRAKRTLRLASETNR